jgi:dipeptidyl aminopeptidase/acylaminoacyl peptidase
MSKNLIATFLLIAIAFTGIGQNGKILKQKEFNASRKLINQLDDQYDNASYADSFATASMHEMTYLSDDYEVKGYMIIPVKPGKYPCLIYNRDGHSEKGLLNEMFVMEELHKFARWGYVVVASQYRGHAGGDGKDEFGGDDVNDVLNLIPLLTNIKSADTSRIGMYGVTRGSMMTFLAMKYSDKIDAAIAEASIGNLFFYTAEHSEQGMYETLLYAIPEYAEDKLSPLKKRSLVYWADDICKTTPLLIMHGLSDKEVHPSESFEINKQLFRHLHPYRMLLFEGGSNGLAEHQLEKDVAMKTWLHQYVRDERDFPKVINLERRPPPKN